MVWWLWQIHLDNYYKTQIENVRPILCPLRSELHSVLRFPRSYGLDGAG